MVKVADLYHTIVGFIHNLCNQEDMDVEDWADQQGTGRAALNEGEDGPGGGGDLSDGSDGLQRGAQGKGGREENGGQGTGRVAQTGTGIPEMPVAGVSLWRNTGRGAGGTGQNDYGGMARGDAHDNATGTDHAAG